MERNINTAIKLYSGDKPLGLFVEHLDFNLEQMNSYFAAISELFTRAQIANFERLPADLTVRGRFATLFKNFNKHLEAAKIQGFSWDKLRYEFRDESARISSVVELELDERIYLILALRYKELFNGTGGGGGRINEDIPFEIVGHLTEIDTGVINADYMNTRFEKFLKTLENSKMDKEEQQATLDELHKSFASLTQEEQKYANIFLHEVQNGDAKLEAGKTFRDYITEYQYNAKNDQIKRVSLVLGLDETKLRNMMNAGLTEGNINEYGRLDDLKKTVDKEKAKDYFENILHEPLPVYRVNIKAQNLLEDFILKGGFEV